MTSRSATRSLHALSAGGQQRRRACPPPYGGVLCTVCGVDPVLQGRAPILCSSSSSRPRRRLPQPLPRRPQRAQSSSHRHPPHRQTHHLTHRRQILPSAGLRVSRPELDFTELGHRAEQYSLAIGRLWDCGATAYMLRSAARGSVLDRSTSGALWLG